jgi:hypothetical protein
MKTTTRRRFPSRSPSLALLLAPFLLAGPAAAMSSPWWENYDLRDRYLCSDQGTIVVERNDAQASILTGRSRTTLFREKVGGPAIRYRNDLTRLILRGDELTLERLPFKLTCVRTEEA